MSNNGNYTPRRDTTPRLPYISQPFNNNNNNNQPNSLILLDQHQYGMVSEIAEERRARILLEEQIRVISSVCKKLNQDIEVLDSQLNEKTFQFNNLEFKTNDLQAHNFSSGKDIQSKLTRHDNMLNKLEIENANMLNNIKELQLQFQDNTRSISLRMNEIENRISDLNKKFDSGMTEQIMVLKNVEGDTVKQLQLIDGKTRTMLEDVRSQMNQTKANQEAELSRLETRILLKMDESLKNTEKYDRLDRKIEEHTQTMNKRFVTFEEEFQRSLNKLASTTEKLEDKVNRGIDNRFTKTTNDYDKLKNELKFGFENLQESIITLQRVLDGKIKLSEDKLEKEIKIIRNIAVTI